MGTGQKALPKSTAWILVSFAVAAVAVCGLWLGFVRTDLVPMQMAGSAHNAACLISPPPALAPSACRVPPTATQNEYRRTVLFDGVLIAAYGLALVVSNYLGWRVAWTRRMKMVAWTGLWLAVAAIGFNIAQDVLLLIALAPKSVSGDWIFRFIQALAVAKFSTLVVGFVIGICSLTMTVRRLTHARKRPKGEWPKVLLPAPVEHPSHAEVETRCRQAGLGYQPATQGPGGPRGVAPPSAVAPSVSPTWRLRARLWTRDRGRVHPGPFPPNAPVPPGERPVATEAKAGAGEHWRQMANVPKERKPAEMGICVSGGGVRSATVALGALQSLRDNAQLEQASYLVSVSGGGYTSGAFQLALTPAGQPEGRDGTANPDDVFAPGSAEEDHVRRHSSYLADDLGQWLFALGILLRNLIGSFALLGLIVTVTGIALGSFYRVTKIATIDSLLPRFLTRCGTSLSPGQTRGSCPHLAEFPSPSWGVTSAVLALGGLALAAYVIPHLWPRPDWPRAASWQQVALAILAVGGLVAVIGVGLPAVVWTSAWVTYHVGLSSPGRVVSAATGTAVLSYVGVLATVLWRKRKPIAGVVSKAKHGQALPNSMVQSIIIWICLMVLCVAILLASGWVASSPWSMSRWALIPVGALLAAGSTLDQTWLSLHPFYRRRLASAFAVRRVDGPTGDIAVPYRYSVPTQLSVFGKQVRPHPKVIFAAAANINGEGLTPPGRRVVSFTMADDYVGGAQVGWVATNELEGLVEGGYLHRDLTLEAAVAISGAAIASAMGRQTRYYELFLCMANIRLGAWLPNPRFIWLMEDHKDDWTFPGLPSRRHLTYLARELFNIHQSGSPLLFCTDGGHYENLGLVELLRHKCRIIYCIDATGDSAPLATTLAEAITLAREELGVTITPRNPLDLVPGGAAGLQDAPLHDLAARLSKKAVCIADITYPDEVLFYRADGEPATTTRRGTLIVAKTALTSDMPYELLSFAQQDKAFPRDSTSDQWFNGDQFDAYQRLGVFIGDNAIKAAKDAGVIDDDNAIIPASTAPLDVSDGAESDRGSTRRPIPASPLGHT